MCVCVCMRVGVLCVHACVCMHVCVHVCVCVCMHAHACTCLDACLLSFEEQRMQESHDHPSAYVIVKELIVGEPLHFYSK